MEMYQKMNEIGENIISLRTVYNIMESIEESYFAIGADKELIMTGIEAVWYMTRRLGEDVGSCEEAMKEAWKQYFSEQREKEEAM